LFPARIFKDMKCCGNSFCVIHQAMLNVATFMLIPATFYFIAFLERCFIYVIVSQGLCLSYVIVFQVYFIHSLELCYCYFIACQAYMLLLFLGDVLPISLLASAIFHCLPNAYFSLLWDMIM
jgi:hypothetical protein